MKNSKNKLKKHKICKISTTGLGIITTSSILAIAISCGGGGTKEPSGDTENQEIVDAITLEEIQKEIQNLFTGHLDKTATNAKAAVAATTVIIKGATVTFTLGEADDAAKNITYTINKITKGDAQRNVDKLGDLGSIITGFKTQAWIGAKVLIEEKVSAANQVATKDLIKTAVEGKFTAKEQPVADAITAVGDLEATIAGGVLVTFTAKAKASDSTILEFEITKLSKNNFELTTGLDTMGGEITGFWSLEKGNAKILIDGKLKDQASIDIFKANIKTKIKTLYDDKQKPSVTMAGKATHITVDEIKVDFTPSANDNDGKIAYVIDKLSSNGYELLNTNSQLGTKLDGEITGLKAPSRLDLPTEKNLPIISINTTGNHIGKGTLTRSEANFTNTTVVFEWKNSKSGTYATFGTNTDFENGSWLKITWTANSDYIFNNGSQTYSIEYEVKLYSADAKLARQEIMQALYTDKAITKTNIKTEIEKALGDKNTQSAEEAIVLNDKREITIANSNIKVKFNVVVDANSATSVNYTITQLSKNGEIYNNRIILTNFDGQVSGFESQTEVDKLNQAIVDGITQQEIQNKIKDEFDNLLNSTATNAKNLMTKTEVTVNGATVKFTLETANDANKEIPYTINEIVKGSVKRATDQLDALKGKIIGFKTQAEIDNADKQKVDRVSANDIKTKIETLFTVPKNTKLASKWKTDLNATTTVTLANGVIVTFAWGNADNNNKTLDYTISKVKKGTQERSDLTGLSGTIDGFPGIIAMPNETNFPIIVGSSANANDGVLIKTEGAIANTIIKYELGFSEDGNYSDLWLQAPIEHGSWLKMTWETNDGYLFADGSNKNIIKMPVIVYAAAQKPIVEEILQAVYVDIVVTQGLIKAAIETALGDKATQGAQEAIDATSKEVTLTSGIKVKFNASVDSALLTNIKYTITELSKGGVVYNTQTKLAPLNGIVAGFLDSNAANQINDKIIKALTQKEINDEIKKLFTTHLGKSASGAKAAVTETTIVVKGATVTFSLIAANDIKKEITYTISKIQKGNMERVDANNLQDLGGIIGGFQSQTNADQFAVDNVESSKIKAKIEDLFTSPKNSKFAATWKTDLATTTFVDLDNGVKVTFNWGATDQTNQTLNYVVTKVERNGKENSGDLSNLSDKINGFAKEIKLPSSSNLPRFKSSGIIWHFGAVQITNTTQSFKIKRKGTNTYVSYSILNTRDHENGDWVQTTWITNDGYLFGNGSNTYSLESEVKLEK